MSQLLQLLSAEAVKKVKSVKMVRNPFILSVYKFDAASLSMKHTPINPLVLFPPCAWNLSNPKATAVIVLCYQKKTHS